MDASVESTDRDALIEELREDGYIVVRGLEDLDEEQKKEVIVGMDGETLGKILEEDGWGLAEFVDRAGVDETDIRRAAESMGIPLGDTENFEKMLEIATEAMELCYAPIGDWATRMRRIQHMAAGVGVNGGHGVRLAVEASLA